MVKNDKLKCFVGTANNGAKYRACLPKNKKPYKEHQDLRGKPHPESKRKQPRQLAYEGGVKAYKSAPARKAREAKAGVDSGRAIIMRRWNKKIRDADSKEKKAELSKKRNEALARYEANKKKQAKKEEPKKPKFNVVKKLPVKKKPKFNVVKKAPAKKVKKVKVRISTLADGKKRLIHV